MSKRSSPRSPASPGAPRRNRTTTRPVRRTSPDGTATPARFPEIRRRPARRLGARVGHGGPHEGRHRAPAHPRQRPGHAGHSKDWPSTEGHKNLLLYEDPEYNFAVNAVVRKPNRFGSVHDHAHAWTAYGLLDGVEKLERFERLDDGCKEGYADVKLDWRDRGPRRHRGPGAALRHPRRAGRAGPFGRDHPALRARRRQGAARPL